MYPYDSADNVRTNLKSLSNYIDDLLVVRTSTIAPGGLTYIWTVTFTHNNGDVNMLVADTTSLTSTSTGTTTVTIAETQRGSFIKGTMALTTTYPHVYTLATGSPSNYQSTGLRFNIPAAYLDSVLEAKQDGSSNSVWGSLTVVRTSTRPHQQRGGRAATRGQSPTLRETARCRPSCQMPRISDSAGNSPAVEVGYASATCDSSATATITMVARLHTRQMVSMIALALQRLCLTILSAVTGNQVTGTFGLSLVDTNGTTYTGIASNIPVADSNGYALSATDLETYLNQDVSWFSQRNDGYDTVSVSRTGPNSAMGYTYTVTFEKENVGGNVDAFSTITTALTATATASSSLGVGDIAADGSYVVNKGITITEVVTGAQLQGSFQLTFNGYTTGPLNYDVTATVMENTLNDLTSISPSQVTVSRDGPMYNPTTQVKGYVWSITFNSNTWVDPTTDHSTSLSGNWYGSATTRTDTWPSGYSKAWGKNVGDQPMIVCADSSLYVTGTGALPTDGCLVEEVEKGTPPLAGTFTLSLDTTTHDVIAVQAVNTTNAISHNAPADATASGGDGTRCS